MHRLTRRIWLFVLCLALPLATSSFAAATPPKRNINDNDTVTIPGNVHPNARPEFDRGPTDPKLRYERMVLLLEPRQSAKDSVDKLIAQQHDPQSPLYQQWLTPEQFGKRFGIGDDDLSAVTAWLQRNGFTIDEVAAGRGWINFSGTVADVQRAFHTPIHDFVIDGKTYHANTNDPQVPRALRDIVGGVVTLHNFPKHPMNHGFRKVSPDFTSSSGAHYLAPADFAKIYNVNPLYTASINGAGQTVAIVGRTDIALGDVQYFRSYFGLPANDPVFVHNGTDPGNLGSGEEGEADLDVEWSGAVAPSATIKFVISASTTSTDGVDLSAQYIVNNNLAPVMSTSFGQCESSMGTSENNFYNNLWSQAATQGITAFVSAGDSGASGCDGGSSTTGSGDAVSGLSSTPYNVAVGGTQFNDTASPSTYWSSTNNSTNQSSALGYIPEVAWNESGNVTGGSGLWATGGGVSTIYAKPSWQSCVGVPADGKRDVPDVALSAAGHDGYLVIQGHTSTASGLSSVGGTSASSPSFAGLMALVVQKTGARQGNANTKFYSLANAQYASGGTVMFHDITSGNNSVPGVTGYNCGTGYDPVTGVGTVDANAMVTNWSGSTATPDFTIAASPTSASVAQGASGSSTISTTVSGGFNNAVSLSASGAPSGTTVSFNPASIAAPGSGSSTMTIAVGSSTATGTYSITVTGTGGSTTHTCTVSLTVTAAGTGGGTAVTNGGFETGSFSGWTTSGVATVSSAAKHSGSWGAQLGNGSPSTDSTTSQTFTMPSGSPTLTFWYANTCPDTVAYDWATATLKDNATGTTTTLLAKTCTASPTWTQVTYNGSSNAGHSVTLTLTNHDDNYSGDPTYTYFDDVAVTTSGSTDTTPPNTSVTAPASGATVSGTITVSATASDNVGVTKMEIYIDGALKTSNTNATSLSYSWNTTTVANGSHTIVSKAYDAAGNVGTSATITVTVSNSSTTTQLLGNPGFENGSTSPAPWTTTSGVIDNSTSEAAHSGSWKAWLDGYGSAHTDTVAQTVSIPAGKTSATLTFWLHVDTAETTTTSAYDTLQVQIRNSSGTVLATLATYSNLNAASGYTQKSFDVGSYIGQTIQVYLVGTEDSSLQTSFVVDDFALNVQ